MKKYEYLTKWEIALEELNELGKDGWRLINTVIDDQQNTTYFLERELN